jgi:hypothetical protein
VQADEIIGHLGQAGVRRPAEQVVSGQNAPSRSLLADDRNGAAQAHIWTVLCGRRAALVPIVTVPAAM